jgi:Flp pilus assembly protein TadD
MIRWQHSLVAGFVGMVLGGTLHAAAPVTMPAASTGDMTPAQSAQLAADLAGSMEHMDKYADAIAQYERALSFDSINQKALRRLGVLYSRTGQFERAEVCFRNIASLQPHNANVFNDWGRSYYLRGNWAMAEKKFRHALEIEPNHRLATNNLALTLGQEKHYAEAFQMFRDGGLSDAQAHCNMAYILSTQGRAEEARSACQLARRLDPNCTKADEMLAQLNSAERPTIEKATYEVPAAAPATATTMGPVQPATPTVTPAAPVQSVGPQPIYTSPNGVKWYPK